MADANFTLNGPQIGLLRLAVILLKRDREKASLTLPERLTGQELVTSLVKLGDEIRELTDLDEQLYVLQRATLSTARPVVARLTVGGC